VDTPFAELSVFRHDSTGGDLEKSEVSAYNIGRDKTLIRKTLNLFTALMAGLTDKAAQAALHAMTVAGWPKQ